MNRNTIRTLLAALLLPVSIATMGQGVSAAEYFWDNDPGAGNGTAMLPMDGSFGQAVEAILLETSALPAVGPHTLGIRVRDANNNWGALFTTVVVVDASIATAPDIEVTTAEYFWDSDPGVGNGTAMVAFDGNYNDALEAIMLESSALPAIGAHVLHIRARDANNAWGPAFSVVVDVMPGVVSFPEIKVTRAEYYVNDDPGAGSGMPLLAVDGDFSSAFEALRGGAIPVPVTSGVNVLWLRARDANGNWGPSFGIVANIDTTITGTVDVPEFVDTRGMVLLPNPAGAAQGFAIRFSDVRGDVRVVLVDAGGRMVAEHHAGATAQVEVPLQGVVPGVYNVGVYFREGRPEWRRLVVH
ncbi:MAG: hypothetical protein KF797_04175 [Flavobacteriales bacterium]|nr:hypothetical protein [Flavobacteriales bacterium]